jgi:hypothetical protein
MSVGPISFVFNLNILCIMKNKSRTGKLVEIVYILKYIDDEVICTYV